MENRPDGERKCGVQVENRCFEQWKDTKTHAKPWYFRTGQKSEKHRLAENRGKTARICVCNSPKSLGHFFFTNACGSSCFAGGLSRVARATKCRSRRPERRQELVYKFALPHCCAVSGVPVADRMESSGGQSRKEKTTNRRRKRMIMRGRENRKSRDCWMAE